MSRLCERSNTVSTDSGKWNNRDNHKKGGDFSVFGKDKDRFVLDFG